MNTRSLPRHALGTIALLSIMSCSGSNPAPDTAVDAATGMSALPAALNAAGPLLNTIGASVPGLSQVAQILGAGSLFGLAKQRMTPEQYGQVAGVLPGADALASEATRQGLPKNMKGLKDVTNFLSQKGITPAQTGGLITGIGEAMKGRVTPDAATTFFNVLR